MELYGEGDLPEREDADRRDNLVARKYAVNVDRRLICVSPCHNNGIRVNAFTTGYFFFFTSSLEVSMRRGLGALKGLTSLSSTNELGRVRMSYHSIIR